MAEFSRDKYDKQASVDAHLYATHGNLVKMCVTDVCYWVHLQENVNKSLRSTPVLYAQHKCFASG